MDFINSTFIVYSIYVTCDADLRKTNSRVEESSREWTLEDAVKKYSEWEYRRGLVFGWGSV
ncbi:hypothetical protein [Desulfosporosinus sp. OT]|uniref:hypothetical protein n=1 Tax=Desulfosporosinus sp. OT TaxID=913865 RepID=UPI000223A8B7|nr:hypothetical protein [Desulfosporosinus sp. OT]EGW40501.1 hypothetical protein DOT_1573 [Desulfosporosinus sp. OT]